MLQRAFPRALSPAARGHLQVMAGAEEGSPRAGPRLRSCAGLLGRRELGASGKRCPDSSAPERLLCTVCQGWERGLQRNEERKGNGWVLRAVRSGNGASARSTERDVTFCRTVCTSIQDAERGMADQAGGSPCSSVAEKERCQMRTFLLQCQRTGFSSIFSLPTFRGG